MKLSKTTRAHLIFGSILVLISLALAIFSWNRYIPYLGLLIYFIGTWGGVEIGRYIESKWTDKVYQ